MVCAAHRAGWSTRIRLVDGSNEQAWPENNGYTTFMSVASPSQLLVLLRRGRIGTALMDERVMTDLQAGNQAAALDIKAYFVRYAPLHLYLTEAFVARHPKFLPEFNRMLPACMEGQLALSETEESRIRVLADRLIKELHGTLNIRQAVEAGPRQQSFTDVMTQDSVWQALAPDTPTALASYILQLPGSRALHGWKRSISRPFVSMPRHRSFRSPSAPRSSPLNRVYRIASLYWV